MNMLKITFLLTCLTLLLVVMGTAIGGLALAIIAPMAAMLIQMAISRPRESLLEILL